MTAAYFSPGLPVPPPGRQGPATPFWKGLVENRLRIQRCRHCRSWQWGPEYICSTCHSFELEWVDVEPKGTIYSWTRIWQATQPALAGAIPYLVVLVELDAALACRPDDAEALSERGLAWLLAGELSNANEDLALASRKTKSPALLGTIWYRRGLVDEKDLGDDGAKPVTRTPGEDRRGPRVMARSPFRHARDVPHAPRLGRKTLESNRLVSVSHRVRR